MKHEMLLVAFQLSFG